MEHGACQQAVREALPVREAGERRTPADRYRRSSMQVCKPSAADLLHLSALRRESRPDTWFGLACAVIRLDVEGGCCAQVEVHLPINEEAAGERALRCALVQRIGIALRLAGQRDVDAVWVAGRGSGNKEDGRLAAVCGAHYGASGAGGGVRGGARTRAGVWAR